jgi:hypothetical protein
MMRICEIAEKRGLGKREGKGRLFSVQKNAAGGTCFEVCERGQSAFVLS